MKLLILTVLLSVMQAAPPVPRQVSADAGRSHQQEQHQREAQKPPSNAQPFQRTNEAESPNDATKDRAAHDETYRVVVERLPEKDALDRWYVYATAALALVALFTFMAIIYQAVKTRDAADAAFSAVKAALKQIQITTERERPRISVEVQPLCLKDLAQFGVGYVVDCWCPTPAFIVDAWVHLGFNLAENERPSWRMSIPLGQQVRESTKATFRLKPPLEPVSPEIIKEIEAGNKVPFFCGVIRYRGVHLSPADPPYRTSFRWKWNARDFSEDPDLGIDFSGWERDGAPKGNERT